MKTKIKFIAPIALTVFFVFTLAYGINTKFESILNIFSPSITDTTDDPNADPVPSDISQMFNERGFYKSNSFSADENEIINDFNGNLIYEIPLYNFKGDGDVNLDMKLVYNGSVDHQVILRDSITYASSVDIYTYNINSPEWIFSVNGIGVQTLNFETRFLTKPKNSHHIIGSEVKKLIPGYHFDDKMVDMAPGEKDRIRILAGDGSLITLVNKYDGSDQSLRYIGSYYSDLKGSHIKANVYFSPGENGTDWGYMKRTVELMMGDGLLYIFKEHKPNYEDVTTSSHVSIKRPKIMLLDEIRDMFGHHFYLTYDDNSTALGRPRLYTVGFGINIEYGYPNGILISNYTQGNYSLIFDDYINYGIGGNKYGFLYRIKNPLKQEAIITSQGYQRKLSGVPCNVLNYSATQNLLCNDLKRILEFRNFFGSKRKYEYKDGNDFCSGGVCISIVYSTAMNYYHSLASAYNEGYGRDPFYLNMVSKKSDFDENGKQKSESIYTYSFSDPNSNFTDYKIDTNDTYTTSKNLISKDPVTVNISSSFTVDYKYKIYPVKTYGTAYNPEVVDLAAVTKLVEEQHKDGDNNLKETIGYLYERGSLTGSVLEGYFSGSFLMLTRSHAVDDAVRIWDYVYKYKENHYDSILSQKIEVDPNGYKKQTYFANFDLDINFLRGWAMLGTAEVNAPDTISIIGQKKFYKIGIDTLVRYFSNNEERRGEIEYLGYSDQLLKQSRFIYIEDTGSSNGYYGQLRYAQNFAEGSTANYIETKYEYYRKDTEGRNLYGTNKFRFIEGNLKLVQKPGNQEEKYYYYPVVRVDTLGDYDEPIGSIPLPKIYYKVKYSNGTEAMEYNAFIDTRLPTRIVNFYRTGPNSVDTLKTVCMNYNDKGNPAMMVNENGYLTYINYDNTYGRVRRITLPGDFSTSMDTETPEILVNTYRVANTFQANGWGHIDYAPQTDQANFWDAEHHGGPGYFTMKFNNDDYQGSPKAIPFIYFNGINLSNYLTIDSAIFFIAPQWYTVKHLNDYTIQNGYEFTVKAVTALDDPTLSSNSYTALNPVVDNYSVSADLNSSLFRDYPTEAYRTCETNNPHYIRVEDLLNYHIIHDNDFKGFAVNCNITDMNLIEDLPNLRYRMIFTECSNFDTLNWLSNYVPKLTIYGLYRTIDTISAKTYYGGTYLYEYDDIKKTVTVKSRVNHSQYSNNYNQIKYRFDGFGNVKRKDIYKSLTSFDSLLYQFNFINKSARTFDGTYDTTMFSYDYAGRQFKTKNSDQSSSTVNYSYQDDLQTSFYNITNGFIEKQTFTDETGRYFNKYFDAVGNLLREEKKVAGDGGGNIQNTDTPFDPDTTYEGQDIPGDMISLITDYKYDNLYRLIQVKTPGNKDIFYYYDGYGRQVQRRTTDAGHTYYSYDYNNNLILSQDANQRAVDSRLNTRRYYDGLNRLLTIGDIKIGAPIGSGNGPMGDTTLPFEFDSPLPADSLYIINVYDTISLASVANVFTELPSGYTAHNYTRGKLVATAYRTILGNNWNFKYYRYDQRGNLVKMWHKIDGLGWKVIDNLYNSQNQATRLSYQAGQSDGKVFTYGYDDAGRLQYTNLYVGTNPGSPEEETDYPSLYLTMASYTYNPDQQVLTSSVNVSNPYTMTNAYNNRNWLKQSFKTSGVFGYTLQYNANGNIREQVCFGTYVNNFSSQAFLRYTYTYDNSNRLLKADEAAGSSFDIINNFDKDGNFVSMKRYGSSNNLVDNFSYSYFSGTNRLQSIGSGNNYTYDANGNVTYDDKNRNNSYKYDWRNLLTEIRSIKTENGLFGPEDVTYWSIYRYDEAGNRIRKIQYKYISGAPGGTIGDTYGDSILVDEGDINGFWQFIGNTFYVRDAAGKEIAIYIGTSIEQWNIYGLDNVGKISSDNKRYFYLKDHLGSIRAVLDTTNAVVSAQDYDPWGYPLENRTWQANNTKYKFTGKERDNENNYDYFGARYYDSRIGRWGGVEPLFDKYINISPYIYTLNNPLILFDGNGLDVYITGKNNEDLVKNIQAETRNLNLSIDKETGKLTVTQLNNVLTTAETTLLEASNNSKIDVKLNITEENYFEQNGQKQYFAVGGYGGYLIDANGKIEAAQYFNIEHAKLYEKHGGSSVGYSALHEIIESYIGNNLPVEFLNPNHDNSNQIINIDMLNAHKQTVNMLPDPDDSPSIKFRIDAAGSKSAYLYKNNGKIVKIY